MADTGCRPGLSVVLATRNRREAALRTVAALAALPERPPVIVVDNGSTDGTAEALRAAFPEVRVRRLASNRGAVARNVGVALARTELVAFADDDSGWLPGALSSAAARFARYPRLALLAARVLVGPHGRPDPVTEFMASAPLGTEPDLPGPSVLGFLACAAVLRREPFMNVGGFDRAVFFLGEEQRVAYDLAAAGYGLAYCPQVVAWHHPASVPRGPAVDRAALALRNEVLTCWMRRPLRVAAGRTVGVGIRGLADPVNRRALRGLAGRIPLALSLRGRPDPLVEQRLRRLARAERGG